MRLNTVIMVILAAYGGMIVACQTKQQTEEIVVSDEMFEGDEHNAVTSLDFMGIYEGVLPCADCEGIQTVIELGVGNSYVKKVTYLGKENSEVIETQGTFSWNDEGNTITLDSEPAPNQYFVGENVLFHLDMDGNRITGDLADKYRLNKK
ncbi:copper resistance protein NlpE [Mariniradius sediminis]|uniref:Copper resistance protein NlpE n=1 Tax=Mariniradius sediminis TaxID=2909237 RepID=A0ABS9C050_9BACT|nr:copper resistance protein NlpE [Mariniradius sediminis]MCF1752899.1 copper resistance protein NlpE [Mariniradius sediminis]